jgi:hypothetical protein
MLIPTVDLAEASTVRLQEEAFRLYALHRIQASTPEAFLSKCIMTTYVDDDHVEHTIGECLDGFRSARWFRIIVIFDPSGQFALPGYQRSVAWRIAVDREFYGGVKIKSANSRKHLTGDFYFIKVYEDAPLAPETE